MSQESPSRATLGAYWRECQLSRLEHIPHLSHWKKDAEAARVLAGAVENDHG